MTAWNAIPAGQSLGETRADLLGVHFALNEPCSCGCGNPLREPVNMHHGIMPKAVWRYVPKEHWIVRDHPCNLFIINAGCHDNHPGERFFWALACERYGEEVVRAWYREAQRVFRSRLEDYSW